MDASIKSQTHHNTLKYDFVCEFKHVILLVRPFLFVKTSKTPPNVKQCKRKYWNDFKTMKISFVYISYIEYRFYPCSCFSDYSAEL